MKKVIFAILTFIPAFLFANPIWLGVSISEIYFDESSEWTIEIDNKYITSVEYLDSIRIECNSGVATIIDFDTTDFIIITNNNLSNSITINKSADCVKIYSYSFGEYKTDTIAIGDYSGSYLKNIENGQSIARLWGYGPFYKDNSPTIGAENDLDGAKGKIYGHFYDTNRGLIKNKYFFINEGYCTTILQEQGFAGNIEINEEGFYCVEITSRSYSIREFTIYESSTVNKLMQFQPVSFELNEDDSINIDFTRILTSIDKIKQDNILLTNYPNPANTFTYFIFNSEGKNPETMLISLYNIKGQKIDSFIPQSGESKYDCSNLPQGIYIYTLSSGNQIIGVDKLQVVK